ncbi:hypothetical protein Syun_006521 [Stephania yunnanensis]|uniref:Uncharacterized protein n=1 Tax=Stephania yunnanensis TaxID=152371 RepID=A0AAP0PYK7_9MAGN
MPSSSLHESKVDTVSSLALCAQHLTFPTIPLNIHDTTKAMANMGAPMKSKKTINTDLIINWDKTIIEVLNDLLFMKKN